MIMRTYMCPNCAARIEVELRSDQWDAPPPSCPACDEHDMQQDFRPPAIGGSVHSRAAKITEDIISNDYNVANFTPDNRRGGVSKVRYKDQSAAVQSSWSGDLLQQAISIGRQTRMEGGSGLDILKRNLADGTQPDLIEASKRRAIKVW